MKLSPQGLDFIKGFESFVPYVYDDLVPAKNGKYTEWNGGPVKGTLTIGYGHTNAARHPLKIKQGLRITEAEARQILAVDISECEEDVERLVTKPLTQGQYDACVSFCFNCGAGNFANIAKRINAGNYAGARAAFDLYTKSKGKVLTGLQRRRDGEQALWDSNIPTVPTEVVDHPAEVDAPKKPTTKELTKVSRKAKWLVWIERGFHTVWSMFALDKLLAGMDIAQDVTGKVKSFVVEEGHVLAIAGAILGALAIKYVISQMREDVEEGRAVPSGEVEAA
jgi:lysozyme